MNSQLNDGLAQALAAWGDIAGVEVLSHELAQVHYGADTTTGKTRRLGGALRITQAESVAPVVRVAAKFGVPLHPISTGHNWGYGTALPAVNGCVIVDLSRLTKILHFDAELGVVTVEPGVTQGILSDFIEAEGHPFMVPTNGAGPSCSILGNALERGYGITPHADHFSAVTDIEAVLADGSIYQGALRELVGEDLSRLSKWGIGPYSVGLFSQSGFGIVTRMTILLAPKPESVKGFLFTLTDSQLEVGVACVRRLLADLPGIIGGINLMNQRRMLSYSAPYPVDKVGPEGIIPDDVVEEMVKCYNVAPWTCLASLYGPLAVVEAAVKHIEKVLEGVASLVIFDNSITKPSEPSPESDAARASVFTTRLLELVQGKPKEDGLKLAYWRNRTRPEAGKPLDPARDGCGLLWYAPLVPIKPKKVREYVGLVDSKCREHKIEPLITLTTLSPVVFDSTVPLLFDLHTQMDSARACLDALIAGGVKIGVHPYRVGIDAMEDLRSRAPNSTAFHRRLRSSLDPQGIISPGRYFL